MKKSKKKKHGAREEIIVQISAVEMDMMMNQLSVFSALTEDMGPVF